MPSPSPAITETTAATLRVVGAQLRRRRKLLRLSATATAEAAGMSRMTLHRIELGEPSVAIGAYLSVIAALGLSVELSEPDVPRRSKTAAPRRIPPQSIRLADYPQLKKLAWQLRGKQELTPKEALDLYERNWRHVEQTSMDARERELVETLLKAFGRERLLV